MESASDLFLNYKQILSQCASLTRGKPLVELSKLYGKWLRVYANDILKSNLNKIPIKANNDHRINKSEIKSVCLVLNTSEYCLSTTIQLEEKLKDQVEGKYKKDISFDQDLEILNSVVSNSVIHLLGALEYSLESSFGQISRISWSTFGRKTNNNSNPSQQVTNSSEFVLNLTKVTKDFSTIVRNSLEQRKYYRSFLDKATAMIVTRLIRTIVKSRPITSLGSEQLLLDLQTLRQNFLEIGNLSRESSTSTSAYVSCILIKHSF